jgi:hypothetical protein
LGGVNFLNNKILNMELRDFIKETISQIIDGITESQEFAKSKKAVVNPFGMAGGNKDGFGYLGYTGEHASIVEFNVALTVNEELKGKASIGVLTGILGIGGQKETGTTNSSISNISFKIPIKLPDQNE